MGKDQRFSFGLTKFQFYEPSILRLQIGSCIFEPRAQKRGLSCTHEKERHLHTDPTLEIVTLFHYTAMT